MLQEPIPTGNCSLPHRAWVKDSVAGQSTTRKKPLYATMYGEITMKKAHACSRASRRGSQDTQRMSP